MHRRLWLSVAMLAAGASLLIAASLASAAGTSAVKKGGIWKLAAVGPGLTMDPQVTYYTTTWWLEYATAAKLYNYPDKAGPAGSRLVPEVASKFTVSKNGKVYKFTIRKGFKFSDGKKVTPKNFVFAIKRVLNKNLQSPGAPFITDDAGTFIKSYKAKGKKLVIRLKKADGTFLAKITMPFFQATSKKLPLGKEITTVTSAKKIPSAGPYTLTYNDPQRTTQIKANKFWKKGPGRHRPRNLKGVTIFWNQQTQQAYLQTLNNEFDEGPVPPENVESVFKRFGKNKSRFWVEPTVCTGYIPLNTANSLFKGNAPLRRAINYVVNRRDYANAPGKFAADPWDHILPPGMPGYFTKKIYPRGKPKIVKARQIAAGHFKNHQIKVWWRSSGVTGPTQKQLINRDLNRLGYSNSQIHFKGFPGGDIYTAAGKRGADFDLALSVGWCQDYPDPYDFINVLLYGPGIQADNNVNIAYFNNPKWNAKMAKAARKVGKARIDAYRKLDQGLTKGPAPWASMRTYNSLYLFSKRVNKKCLVYQGVYQDWSIPALCFK